MTSRKGKSAKPNEFGNLVTIQEAEHRLPDVHGLFERGRDAARRIQYVTFYDPARLPCFNPFAEFDSD